MPHALQCVVLGCLLGPAIAQTFAPLVRPADVGNPSAFDTFRRRLVIFSDDGSTWELDGGELLPRATQNSAPQPRPRLRHAMCYDEVRRRVLMFGGGSDGSHPFALNDTWTYDGVAWTELTSGPAPPSRQRAAMTWDSARNRAVMWGGVTPGTYLSDTWEHDGNVWQQRLPTTSPAGPPGSVAFDRQRSVAVLVTPPGPTQAAETWEWNGTVWALRNTGGGSAGIDGYQTMAFDPSRNRTVIAGAAAVIHEWDGTSWSTTPLPAQPFLRWNAASWFDPSSGCVIFAGGMDRATYEERADQWRWNGQALTQVQDDGGPSTSAGVLIADPARGRVVHFGGRRNSQYSAETWMLANGAWSAMPSLANPSARAESAVTHDLLRGEGLLFGGRDATGLLGDTWSLGSTGWVARSTTGPSPRMNAAMAADVVLGRIVLFGGLVGPIGSITDSSDTWEWDGTLWTQRPTTTQPSARSRAAMAFHPSLGRMLLFGGTSNSAPLNDTWTWDGTHWTRLLPTTVPPPLDHVSMSSDLATNQCTLVGTSFSVAGRFQQVWRHDGSNWFQQTNDRIGEHRWYPCVTSPTLDTMICVRIELNDRISSAAAELTHTPGRVATTGVGCGTPASMLQARSRPRIGASTGLELVANPGRAVLFALDLASGSTPLGGGCTLWLGTTFVSTFQISSPSGSAEQLLSVPANPGLRGLDLFAQAAVLEPPSSNGLVLTPGLRLTLGD